MVITVTGNIAGLDKISGVALPLAILATLFVAGGKTNLQNLVKKSWLSPARLVDFTFSITVSNKNRIT